MELFLAENFPHYCHIEFEMQRQQGHVLACCDDLADHRHVNGAEDECRFVAQVSHSGKGYALSPLNEDVEAGLKHRGIARTQCNAAVQGEAWYRGCMGSCVRSVSSNLAPEFSPQLIYAWRLLFVCNLLISRVYHEVLLCGSRIAAESGIDLHEIVGSDRNRQ